MARIVEALQRQVTVLREAHSSWTLADSNSLFSSARGADWDLLKLLEASPNDSALRPWLLTLPCGAYAAFMRAMYGTVHGGGVSVSVAEAVQEGQRVDAEGIM